MEELWLQRISDDDIADELEETSTPIRLLKNESREFLWWICKMFKVNHSGIPGQACQLFERALPALVKSNVAIQGENARSWRNWKRDQKSRLPLLMTVCVWLAAKMCTAEVYLSTAIICQKLMRHGFVFTPQTIRDTEMKVYSCLNFRIPVWTTVDKALLLAKEVGLNQLCLNNIGLMVDYAEYRRQCVQNRVVRVARDSTPSTSNSSGPQPELRNMRNSHFCAGAVVAVFHSTMGYKDPELVPKLARLTNSTDLYINCIADAILHYTVIFQEYSKYGRKPTLKRKRNEDSS